MGTFLAIVKNTNYRSKLQIFFFLHYLQTCIGFKQKMQCSDIKILLFFLFKCIEYIYNKVQLYVPIILYCVIMQQNKTNSRSMREHQIITLWPSKTNDWSSIPSSISGLHPGRAQPTRMSPPVIASNSKYHFPVFTAYVFSTRKRRMDSMPSFSTW